MRRICCLVMLALCPPIAGLADESSLTAMTEPFNEHLTERVPVGGRSLVGVVATPTAELPDGTGLISGRLALPGSVAGAVCVRARTQDGTYEAENTYVSAAKVDSSHTLQWSAKFEKELKVVPLRQVAALTTLGACGSAASVVIPIGMSGATEIDGQFLQVLVNTRGAPTWAVLRDPVAGGRALLRSHCVRLEDGARVAFDARCSLGPMPVHGPLELRLEQEGRDGLSLEVVAKVAIRTRDAQP